jgi:hypothetical protein
VSPMERRGMPAASAQIMVGRPAGPGGATRDVRGRRRVVARLSLWLALPIRSTTEQRTQAARSMNVQTGGAERVE